MLNPKMRMKSPTATTEIASFAPPSLTKAGKDSVHGWDVDDSFDDVNDALFVDASSDLIGLLHEQPGQSAGQ